MEEFHVRIKPLLLLFLLLVGLPVLTAVPTTTHAASPTITITSSSGTGGVNVGVEVDGSGFPSVSSAGVSFCMLDATQTITASCSASNTVAVYGQSLFTSGTTIGGNVVPDANGVFRAFFDVPSLPWLAGGYNFYAIYTPSGGSATYTAGVPFTINPYLDVRLANDLGTLPITPTTRSAHYGQWMRIRVYGFAASDTVTVTGLPVPSGTTVTLSTGTTGKYVTQQFVQFVSDKVGGATTFTASGAIGGTATRSFTIKPAIAIYGGQTTMTELSIPATAPATAYMSLHGFANAETISAITVAGQSTAIGGGSATTSSAGVVGAGASNHLTALYTSNLPYGPAVITVTGSTTGTVTFSAANGNIINPFRATGITTPANGVDLENPSIIASTTQGSGKTAIQGLSETSGYYSDTVVVYYEGLSSADTVSGSASFDSGTYTATLTCPTTTNFPSLLAGQGGGTADPNGVAVCTFAVPAMPKGAHTLAAPTGGTQTPTLASTTFTENPLLLFYSYSSSDGGYGINQFTNSPSSGQAGYFAVSGYGFKVSSGVGETLTLTVGTQVVTTASALTPSSAGTLSLTALSSSGTGFPDLASGTYTVTVQGATASNNAVGVDAFGTILGQSNLRGSGAAPGASTTGYDVLGASTVTVAPNFALTSTLSQSPGTSLSAGQTIVLQSTSSAGIHGLKASTAYTVSDDSASGTVLTTFTSTSGGLVPAGVQWAVPSISSGNHIVDISASGTSAVFGQTYSGPTYTGNEGDESTYGQLYMYVVGTVAVTPSAGNVGTTVTLSGSGISASTPYTAQISGITYASFTSTAAGAIPAGASFTFPATATSGSTGELGTSITIGLYNGATRSSTADASGTFLLQSALGLNMTTRPAGGAIAATASGLVSGTVYNIVWGATVSSSGVTQGTIVGTVTGKSDGSASTTFTVPATAATGTYTVQLIHSGDLGSSSGIFRLVSPPSVTVGGAVGTVTTATFTTSGTPSKTVVNGQATISGTFTNTASSSLSVYMWVSVMNSAGQTVGVFLGSATVAAGGTATIGAALFNLPSGTYTAQVFLTTTSGIVASSTSTTSSFSV